MTSPSESLLVVRRRSVVALGWLAAFSLVTHFGQGFDASRVSVPVLVAGLLAYGALTMTALFLGIRAALSAMLDRDVWRELSSKLAPMWLLAPASGGLGVVSGTYGADDTFVRAGLGLALGCGGLAIAVVLASFVRAHSPRLAPSAQRAR